MRIGVWAAILGAVAFVAAALPAAAQGCDGLQAADKVVLRPFVSSKRTKVKIGSAECADGRAVFRFSTNGKDVATVDLARTGDRSDVSFQFLAPMENVSFGVTATVKAQSAEAFDIKRTVIAEGRKDRAVVYYPFDWSAVGKRSVRHGAGVIPGFSAGGLNVVYDAPKLGAINIQRQPGRIIALFPFYREINDKGDRALNRHDATADMAPTMRFYVHAGLAHIQDQRFAEPDRKGMEGAHIAQMAPRAWTPDPAVVDRAALLLDPEGRHCAAKKPGAGRACFPTDAEVTAFADAMPKENSIVIARFALPLARAAAAIKAGGATPYYYLFFGAIGARDGDPSFKEKGYVLTDSAGQPHMAPYSTKSKGNWFLLDLAQPAARKYFVDRALEALDNGYEGIFMDGGFLWNMPNGKVGGDNSGAAFSHYQGRMLLMEELRAAMRAKNPNARLGILANAYAEYMHYADWILREGTALHWSKVKPAQHLRALSYDPSRKSLKVWQSWYGRLVTSPTFYACKGPNPLMIRTCQENLGLERAGFYYDSGDWNIHNAAAAAAMAEIVYRPGDLYVTRVEKGRKLYAEGVSGVRAEEGPTRVWLSRAAPVLREANMTPFAEVEHVFRIAANEVYRVADRQGPGGWNWAAEGFLHRSADAYVAGDFYALDDPTEPTPGALRVVVGPSPRATVAKATPLSRGMKAEKQTMSFKLALPAGAAWRLETLDGSPVETGSGGRKSLTIEGHSRLALTVTGLAP